jgi:mono/diheme cytochrome c family protein
MPHEDADALFAWMRSLPPSNQSNRPHQLRFPYDRQWALAAWRLLYFRPGAYVTDKRRSAEWNRGAYLVEGPGHCGACHSARNVLGASEAALSGGLVAASGWYAPSLASGRAQADLVQLLHTGAARDGAVYGPMAEVVAHSLQYLDAPDVRAMAVYLSALPAAGKGAGAAADPSGEQMKLGKRLYDKLCADCHGRDGSGAAAAYAALAGNRTLAMDQPVNAIRIVLSGGFPPSTGRNPRPYGMPPFSPLLSDEEVAAVVTYVRNSWGNAGRAVTAAEVNRYRAVPLD